MKKSGVNLDHCPARTTYERLPDGRAWVRLYANINEVAMDEGVAWEADEASMMLSDAGETSEAEIDAAFDDWYARASAWQPGDDAPPTLEQRVAASEAAILALMMAGEGV